MCLHETPMGGPIPPPPPQKKGGASSTTPAARARTRVSHERAAQAHLAPPRESRRACVCPDTRAYASSCVAANSVVAARVAARVPGADGGWVAMCLERRQGARHGSGRGGRGAIACAETRRVAGHAPGPSPGWRLSAGRRGGRETTLQTRARTVGRGANIGRLIQLVFSGFVTAAVWRQLAIEVLLYPNSGCLEQTQEARTP